MSTLSPPSRNPFRSNPATPLPTGQSTSTTTSTTSPPSFEHLSPPPSFSSSPPSPAPPNPNANIDGSSLRNDNGTRPPPMRDPDLEEPPPYTASPSTYSGESTVEHGPSRPFQPAPRPAAHAPQPHHSPLTHTHTHTQPQNQNHGWGSVQNHVRPGFGGVSGVSGVSGPSSLSADVSRASSRAGYLLQQLANSVVSAASNYNSPSSISQHHSGGGGGGGGGGGQWGVSTQPTGQGWSNYPGGQQQQQQPYLPPLAQTRTGLLPPPRHPLSPSASTPSLHLHPQHTASSSAGGASSDFARDFYAAGSGGNASVGNVNVYAPPPGAPPGGRPQDRPPPPPPPPSGSGLGLGGRGGGEGGRGAGGGTTRNGGHEVVNDGRPTTFPCLGHPLLKDGKLLVYPKGYECEKCNNVGYKSADPNKPCKKCWSKYAKPFLGPLAYSFSSPSTPSVSSPTSPTSASTSNFQRPLPSVPSTAPPPPAFSFSFSPPPPGSFPHQPPYPPQPPHPPYHTTTTNHPPPGSLVYTAGDPRIGGRLCWRCGGKGSVSYLVIDRETCVACGGVGRTF
ncbi:hypothetical protein B0H34DRAFT_796525 [Crassisporium funariophilum]|nr:hypothetical protein B0H34DRAFT_796525 [Crassisporium funariophilum]